MKYLTMFALVCLWCTGCSSYQYATVSSSLNHQSSEGFVAENDTVKIAYAFNGENGPVQISIYNKLQTPLYVDWSRSALIAQDVRRSYWTNQSTLEGNADGTDVRLSRSYVSQDIGFKGIITSRESMSFIPPKSWAKEHQLTLAPDSLTLGTPGARFTTEKVKGATVKSYYYDQPSSPFRFRSFLTLSFKQDMSEPIYFDHHFWVSEVSVTELTPSHFSKKNNQFYIVKKLTP